MKKILITIIVLSVILVSWILSENKRGVVDVSTPTPIVSSQVTPTPLVSPVVSENIVIYTDSGYLPNMKTIKKGETVTWKNESSTPMWTASAAHPSHRGYSGTDIAACGTQTLLPMFDTCTAVAPGQSWAFKFDNIGTWGYHNHVNASNWGKIVVE